LLISVLHFGLVLRVEAGDAGNALERAELIDQFVASFGVSQANPVGEIHAVIALVGALAGALA
jgi:hypothetical protein